MSNEEKQQLNNEAGQRTRPARVVNLREMLSKKENSGAQAGAEPEKMPTAPVDEPAEYRRRPSKRNRKKNWVIAGVIAAAVLALIAYIYFFDNGQYMSGCEKLEKKIRAEAEEMNSCESTADCVLLNGCPYGCNNLINKNADMKKFSELNSQYRDECGECDSSCPRALRPEEIGCAEGKCVSTRL